MTYTYGANAEAANSHGGDPTSTDDKGRTTERSRAFFDEV